MLACSSAGGGLRIAVVGNEELVTAEAGRRVALSSGGKVVAVLAGGLDPDRLEVLRAAQPDVLLLVGGTDGGNSEGLVADAEFLSRVPWTGPVVVAGDIEAQGAVSAWLGRSGTPHVLADNVVPKIGILAPESARRAIREMFLEHVIGGKGLSARADFTAMVHGATPDLVLTGVEVLAAESASDVVVVVTSAARRPTCTPSYGWTRRMPGCPARSSPRTPVTRTVEGDLGMRWSALTTWEAGVRGGAARRGPPRRRRTTDRRPVLPPDHRRGTSRGRADRHGGGPARRTPPRRPVARGRRPLTGPGRRGASSAPARTCARSALLVGSGGVLRHADPATSERILEKLTGVSPDGLAAAGTAAGRRGPRLRARCRGSALGAPAAGCRSAGT